jgi:hypothetical protein
MGNISSRRRMWLSLPSAHYLAHTEFVWGHWWLLNVSSRYRFMSRCLWILAVILTLTWRARHELIPYLCPYALVNAAKIFVLNRGSRTKTGSGFISAVFWVRIILGSVFINNDTCIYNRKTPAAIPKSVCTKYWEEIRQELSRISVFDRFVALLKPQSIKIWWFGTLTEVIVLFFDWVYVNLCTVTVMSSLYFRIMK